VLQQSSAGVSRNALNTITGRLKVSIQVSVDASGNVSQAKFVSHGPSQYFATRAMAAAQRWKFKPPQIDGHAADSEWLLRFQFGRTSIEAFPAEVKPLNDGLSFRCGRFSLIFHTICRSMPSRNSPSPVCNRSRRTKRRTAPSKEPRSSILDSRWRVELSVMCHEFSPSPRMMRGFPSLE